MCTNTSKVQSFIQINHRLFNVFCFLLLTIVYNLNTTKIDRKWGKNIDFYAMQVN